MLIGMLNNFVLETYRNPVLHLRQTKFEFIFSFLSRKLHKNYQMSGKIN